MFSDPTHASVAAAAAVSLGAIVVWAWLLLRIVVCNRHHTERRPVQLTMPIVGLIASAGTLFSVIGFAKQLGYIDIAMSNEAISLIASMGRGALLMGGIIALVAYHPPKEH